MSSGVRAQNLLVAGGPQLDLAELSRDGFERPIDGVEALGTLGMRSLGYVLAKAARPNE